MSLKTYNIDVPITPGAMPPVIHIGQYDSGREYIAHLKNDDGTDYTIPANSTATFTGCNPRKEVFEIEATVGETTVTFQPSDEATSMWGKYGATINITSGGEKMSPIVLLMDVQKAGATDEEIAGAANFPDAVTEAVNDWLEDNIEEGQLGTLFVPQAPQAAKTSEMTQPVGMDENGKLWTTPGGGSGAVTPASIVTATSQMTTAQKTSTRSNINAAPSTNIAKSALASAVQTSLGKADTAYQKPSGGIPAADMAQAVQTALAAAGTAVQPSALDGYVPVSVFAAVTPSADLVEVKRDAQTGKLYVLVNGSTPAPSGDSNTTLITMTESGADLIASKTASEIYTILSGGAVNLVLIDYASRQGTLVKKPTTSGGGYTDAKFWAFDENTTGIIEYSINSSGVVSYTTIPLAGFYTKPSGGIPYTDLAGDIPASKLNASAQARLLPTASASDAGKIPTVNGSGVYVLEPNAKILTMQKAGSTYTYTGANFQFTTLADLQALVSAGTILWLVNTTTGSAYQSVNSRGAASTARLTFAGPTLESDNDDLTVEAFIFNGSMNITRKVLSTGGGEGGSGAELFEVYITENAGTYAASETLSDIMDAYQAGDIVKYYNEEGAEGILALTPDQYGVVFVCFDDGNGGHPMLMRVYAIAPNGAVTVTENDILNSQLMPSPQSRTAAQIASGIQVNGNAIYTISGEATGFIITTNTLPTMNPGECIEIRLTVGNTAITTPTWPSWCKFIGGWDGKFDASTYYDIVIDDVGNVYAGMREVSA